jgi:hypothetical protein
VYKKLPPARVMVGLFLILLSYAIGWPAVGLLGAISYYTGRPSYVVVGGPLIYGLSHVVFLIGAYYAGKDYAVLCFKQVRTYLRKRNE